MNLRGIKIIDLKHSVLDNDAANTAEQNVANLIARAKTLKTDEAREKCEDDIAAAKEELSTLKKAVDDERRRGYYKFKKKTYVNYRDAGRRPPWKFIWCQYSDRDNYSMYHDWQVQFGSTAVVYDEDGYAPEGIPVNGEGHFVFKDVILMKEDLQKYLRRQMEARMKSERASKAEIDALRSQFAEEGGNLPDGYMEELMSDGGR